MTFRLMFRSSLSELQDNEGQDIPKPILARRSRGHQARPGKRRAHLEHALGLSQAEVWSFQEANVGNNGGSGGGTRAKACDYKDARAFTHACRGVRRSASAPARSLKR